nr:unnamed protein product [Spirometra erinaceieuropaei]
MYHLRLRKRIHKGSQQKFHAIHEDHWTIQRTCEYVFDKSGRSAPFLADKAKDLVPPPVASPSADLTPLSNKVHHPYSPEPPRPPSANSAEFGPQVDCVPGKRQNFLFTQSLMPPGPPTSPVPSPPPEAACSNICDTSSSNCLIKAPVSLRETATLDADSISKTPGILKVKLRRRRNAICGQSKMGKGLREFLFSYVVSHLTDSLTSSLSLENQDNRTATEERDFAMDAESPASSSTQSDLPDL